MKDAVATMGGLLPPDAGGRDAVHVAVFSAKIREGYLIPGQHVAIVSHEDAGDAVVSGHADHPTIGIADPFLRDPIKPGERFWVYLYPRTITALSHRWSHPAFEANVEVYVPPASKLASEKWLRNFIDQSDCPGYEAIITIAEKIADGKRSEQIDDYAGWRLDDEYLHFDGEDAHGEIPPEFWDHIEVVLGRKVIQGQKPTYWSCSC